jgi:TRAP transporter TAXI family solute receptor
MIMLSQHAPFRVALALFLLALLALLSACGGGPGQEEVESAVQDRISQAFPQGAIRLDSLRRIGSSPVAGEAAGGGERRIVYYNATLAVERDIDLSSWQGLNLGAVAGLLGATEKGISGLKPGGNKQGDRLYVHGTVTYVAENGAWQAVRTAHVPVAAPPPEGNTGPPAQARQIVENIRGVFEQAGPGAERRGIVTEELERAYFRIRLRLDRLEGSFVILSGPENGEYHQVARLVASSLQDAKMPASALSTEGSVENIGLLAAGRGDAAFAQGNVATRAVEGRTPFAGDAAVPELRALASLFPEQVHVILSPGADVSSLANLKGKRVDVGQPNSGSRLDAEALLAAAGLMLRDCPAVSGRGLSGGLAALARGELDAVFSTISAPARSVQGLAEGSGLKFLSLTESEQAQLAAGASGYVAATMPPGTYAGQDEAVRTVAAAALLVARADLPEADAEMLLRRVFDGIDFFAAGSPAGSQISRGSARTGVGIPWHPAAERFFATATRADAGR